MPRNINGILSVWPVFIPSIQSSLPATCASLKNSTINLVTHKSVKNNPNMYPDFNAFDVFQ